MNDAYLIAPFADLVYFADSRWWRWHVEGIARKWIGTAIKWTVEEVAAAFKAFAGQKISIFTTGQEVQDPEVLVMRNAAPEGLSEDPLSLRTGGNSGYQAVNLAILAGAKRVVLVGYDGRSEGRLSYWFGNHPIQTQPETVATYPTSYKTMLPQLGRLGVEVLNATPQSRIDVFPRVSLEDAFPGLVLDPA